MVRQADRSARTARASVWLADRTGKGRRNDQPSGLDRDRITAVAVRLLDAEGLAGFSMRRLAAELNVTAMSVYWYVDTKDDLLELALDAVHGELEPSAHAGPGTPSAGQGWRTDLRALAVAYRALLVRHPWVSPLTGSFLNIGPRAVAFSRRLREVMGETGLESHARRGAISSVFQFVYGFGTIEGHFIQRCAAAGVTQDEYFRDALGSIGEQPELAETFGEAAGLLPADGGDCVEDLRERDFAFALDVLIAGIEAQGAR
ncbi:TetR/AcrR family transcriptional regulator [Streptomyces tsukubensis]|uniref:TetR family transcriptional regulator n=1 Tax=Streptomyces tsukubensis TaxID=83656 RepID=A0A1V4A8G4_9ACTN|nr:TetR/AcrR family transcriptional regulator C-terminal domain-containing protein [Streptomyces tsukubensis]OON79181.1 TetR family transcriptional regulator [Streptomyces tsukubensis]QFR94708.1 TetR family transcriptional regulator [Streptomyces tsukubensis]